MQRFTFASLAVMAGVVLSGFARPASAEFLVGATKILGVPVLVGIDTDSPFLPAETLVLRGIPRSEKIIGLDQRPATGEMMLVTADGSSAQLYSVALSGQVTAIGQPFDGLDNPRGTQFGFDFNPTIDRIRLVSTAGQNLVFNPNDGTVTEVIDLFYQPLDENEGETPAVAHIAYDNNVGDAVVTQQRGIDVDLNILVTVGNNAGTLGTIGSLGVNVADIGGFDISGETGDGFAIMTLQGIPVQALFSIDLETGEASPIGVSALGIVPLQGITIFSEVTTEPAAQEAPVARGRGARR